VLTLTAAFEWRDRLHGGAESWWIWVEDSDTEHIYHKELWTLTKQQALEPQELSFTTPLFEPLPPAYYIRAFSDRWLGVETVAPLPLADLSLPSARPAHTDLLALRPLPKSALADARFEALFRFSHFNPVQSQIFHTVMHTDDNVLVGAPTGSGKTVAADPAPRPCKQRLVTAAAVNRSPPSWPCCGCCASTPAARRCTSRRSRRWCASGWPTGGPSSCRGSASRCSS
jgi:activating signal cointegrator complex subunit 3